MNNQDGGRETGPAAIGEMVQWQYRMPEDRGCEDGWMDNSEDGARYLHRECGAELRSRTVSNWVQHER